MSEEGPLELARRFIEAWAEARAEDVARLVTPDVVQHGPGPVTIAGIEALQAVAAGLHRGRWQEGSGVRIDELFATTDRAAARLIVPATYLNDFILAAGGALAPVPVDSHLPVSAVVLYHFRDGRIGEIWAETSRGAVPSKIRPVKKAIDSSGVRALPVWQDGSQAPSPSTRGPTSIEVESVSISSSRKIELVREYIEAWHHAQPDKVAQFVTPDIVQHGPGGITIEGAGRLIGFVRFLHYGRRVFRIVRRVDYRVTIQEIFGSGDLVASRVTAPRFFVIYNYTSGAAAAPIAIEGVRWAKELPLTTQTIFRLAGEKIAEIWQETNEAHFRWARGR